MLYGINSNKNWKIIIADSAKKNCQKIPKNDIQHIITAINQMEFNPFSDDNVKLNKQQNIWSQRVGNYRIIFRIILEKRITYIYEIKRRAIKTY